MNNQTFHWTLQSLIVSLFIISIAFLMSCSDDPQSTNEEEVITTVIVTLDPIEESGEEEGDIITLSWDDLNLDGIVDASEMITSGPLTLNESYQASIQMLNKSADPEIDITEEVREEAEEHIFCFEAENVGISITNKDEDSYGLPLGLTSTWTATVAGAGTVNVTLRHQPGVKTGDCPGAGDTDADITFAVTVEDLSE